MAQTGSINTAESSICGIAEDHHILIGRNGQLISMKGTLYELVPKVGAKGSKKAVRKQVFTSPDYTDGMNGEESFTARSILTDKRYRVIGVAIGQMVQQCAASSPSMQSAIKAPVSLESNSSTRHRSHLEKFKRELDFATAQREAGLDPMVRIEFAALYVGESKANLNRKSGVTFPPPLKRGRGAFYLLSDLDAYKNGTYQSNIDPPATIPSRKKRLIS